MEVLYPKSVEEMRERRFRRCKSCGKFFALTGYSNTEYCDRLFGDSNKACKEVGAVRLYRTKIIADPVVQAFNKAYKKRFSWIKHKKISKRTAKDRRYFVSGYDGVVLKIPEKLKPEKE